MNTFAERFKHARQKIDLSLSKIAEMIGVTPQATWNYENRPDGSVSSEQLFPLADALGVSARWLATGIGEESLTGERSLASIKAERISSHLAALPDEKLHALAIVLGIKL